MIPTGIEPAKFWARVEKTESCWLWRGYIARGYGRFFFGKRGRIRAHRLAFMLTRGPIPDDAVLDHICRNRACVNPAHLEPVSNRENVLRGVGETATNSRKTHCIRGHEFTPDNIRIEGGRYRRCRACDREHSRKHNDARRRAA